MNRKLIAILLLIAVLPLIPLAWLGVSLSRHEQERVQQDFKGILTGRLTDVKRHVSTVMDARERELISVLESLPRGDAESLREVARKHRLIRQVFVLDSRGKMSHPRVSPDMTSQERGFLERTATVWDSGIRLGAGNESDQGVNSDHGWHTWFWGQGLNVMLWRKDISGEVQGIELDRMALISEVVALLPVHEDDHPVEGSIVLCDASDEVIYQWGNTDISLETPPRAVVGLAAPLGAWKLKYFMPIGVGGGGISKSSLFNVLSALGVMAVAFLALAVYFYRESSREMREAAERVSFVNQVSHELKTPLTNIRMYAELLEESLQGSGEQMTQRIGVVVSESQRLTRLINNVLTLGRKQKGTLQLRHRVGVVDEVVSGVINHFNLAMTQKNIEVTFREGAPGKVDLDTDALEQVLGNLLNNVEKYASSGGRVEIETAQDETTTTVTVSDKGPGIPVGHEESLFEPFTRVSSKLTDGVAGTGIGLSIARDLARLHGGDLSLVPSESGATFKLVLATPRANQYPQE